MDICILINFSGEKNMNILASLFGNYSKRELKKVEPITKKVLELDGKYSAMADEELKGQTQVLKDRLAKGETLDDILPDAFAVCREAAWRVPEMKHFPVQITGGIVLHQGRISEMKTGEGKTLVATLPAYLNALSGKGVHIVTVNDYLARRDSEWMGKVYKYLGLSVGLIVHGLSNDERRAAYAADITYGTNNEMGFDYLRDNMVVQLQNKVQRGHNFAIVDEVDSILIDEARTPLIISGQGEIHRPLRACRQIRPHPSHDQNQRGGHQGGTSTRNMTATISSTKRPKPPHSPPRALKRPRNISTWKTFPTWKTTPFSTT